MTAAKHKRVSRTLTTILLAFTVIVIGGGLWLYTPDKSQAALEAKYATAPSQFVEAAGVRLHVRDTGPDEAPAIILLHGFGMSLHTWEPWALALASGFRVIRLDLPGFGLTGTDPTGDYTDARMLIVIAALMDKLGIARASIAGNSMGGRFAWQFAASYPARVEKLILISPDGFASFGLEYGKRTTVPAMVKLMQYALPKPMLKSSLAPAYADPSRLTDDVVTRYHDLMLVPGVRGAIIARMEQLVLEDPVPLLQSIKAPTLLVWGEKDAMIPLSNAADYQKALPESTLVTFPELGHVPHEEDPAQSLVPVRTFLAR
jgi:pimeloyl-ACP methyl ester carboxylesterase